MDVKVGKNKYKLTLPIVLAVGAAVVSAISWFSMIQVNMATMQSEIDKLIQVVNQHCPVLDILTKGVPVKLSQILATNVNVKGTEQTTRVA